MPLSTLAIRNAKPSAKPFKMADGGGLYLLVNPSGGRLWRMDYRFRGKRKTASFGAFPAVSLADAREKREEARRHLASDRDPMAVRKIEKRQAEIAAGNTFEAVAREWFQVKQSGWEKSYADRVISRLEGDVFPVLGRRPIAEIEPPELLDAIRAIERRGAHEMAKRVFNYCGQIFRYAIITSRATRDPSSDLRGALKPSKTKHRAAIKATEMPTFLDKLASYDGERQTQLALRLVLLTFVRTDEIRFARKAEFEALDSGNAVWRIPAERMKMRREHLVPLTPQAVAVVKELFEIAGKSPMLLPAPTRSGVISENTMLYALYRMGYHSRATVHGFRSTASTILNEKGFNRDWIERQLAHVEGNKVRAAYNAAEWLPERRRMMVWWADWLDKQAEIGELVG